MTYRNRQVRSTDGHWYNLKAEKAVLLPTPLRTKTIPRATGNQFGFGQSNLRYCTDALAMEAVPDILRYIDSFNAGREYEAPFEQELSRFTTEELRRLAGDPTGNAAPSYTATVKQRKRNPYLPELAKRRANGVCQLCNTTLNFSDRTGRPYLEAHHIIPLVDDGLDELSNMVALCPNCHRKMHVDPQEEDYSLLKKKAEEVFEKAT